MSERACKTCKHWRPSDYPDGIISPTDPDTMEPMIMPFEVRRCTSPMLQMFDRPTEARRASVCDGSAYRAVLYSGPDFGCVNHEAS